MSDVSDLLLGIKRVKNCQRFSSESLVFASILLESRANHSHRSFLKNNESDLLFKMSDFLRKSKERKNEFPTLVNLHLSD